LLARNELLLVLELHNFRDSMKKLIRTRYFLFCSFTIS
jgi:hypothetical protein